MNSTVQPAGKSTRERNADRVLERVSPSQVEAYELCPRRWYNSTILGVREAMSAAAQRGIDVAEASDAYYKTGVVVATVKGDRGEQERPFAHDALLSVVLRELGPRAPEITTEEWVEQELWPGGPKMRGRYDHFDPRLQDLRLGSYVAATMSDIKCRSSARYAKTPAELANDLQLNAYAKIKLDELKLPRIGVRHVYGITDKKPKAFSVGLLLEAEELQPRWDKTVATAREMVEWARRRPETAEPLAPNTQACDKFPPNGCPHRATCGFEGKVIPLFKRRTPMPEQNGEAQSDLMKRLTQQTANLMQKKSDGQVAPAQALPPSIKEPPKTDALAAARQQFSSGAIRWDAGSGQVYAKEGADSGWLVRPPTIAEKIAIEEGAAEAAKTKGPNPVEPPMGSHTREEAPAIVSPDAPSRVNPPTAEAAPVEEKPKRARKTKATEEAPITDMVSSAAPNVKDVPINEAVQPSTPAVAEELPGPILYINCVPTKGPRKGLGIYFEDWMAPIMEVLCQEKGVVDYRLVSYTAKGDLAAKVRQCASTLKGTVVLVSKFSPSSDVFLEAIIPHASEIVQGV